MRHNRRTGLLAGLVLLLVFSAAVYLLVLRPRGIGRPAEGPPSPELVPAPTDHDPGLPVPGAGDGDSAAAAVADSFAAVVADSSARPDTLGMMARPDSSAGPGGATVPDADRLKTPAPDSLAHPPADTTRTVPALAPLRTPPPSSPRNTVSRDTVAALPGHGDDPFSGRFVVHVSSFKLKSEADAELALFHSRGIEARALRVEVPVLGSWYRIVIGNFATFAEAESMGRRLLAEGKIPSAHIAADGGRGQPVAVGPPGRERP
jgi:hypothetical protein